MSKTKHSNEQAQFHFFVVGAVRSGTTLLRLMLGHHPDICECQEMEYVTPEIERCAGIPKELGPYIEYLRLHKNFRMAAYSISEKKDFVRLARSFLEQRQAADNKPIVGATVHHHFDKLPLIWPDSKYIFLLRDPRDVARSCVKMGWQGSAWGGVRFWEEAYTTWQTLSKTLAENQKLEIRYEDLIANPESSLKMTCEFLGVNYVPSMMDIEQDTSYSKPNAKLARSWRDSASDHEIRQVETKLGEQLELSGYEHSGLAPYKLTAVRRTTISAEDFINRTVFRWKHYGFLLWLANIVSNRVSLGKFNKKIKLQMQEIDIRSHK